jgi:hypothetical protein
MTEQTKSPEPTALEQVQKLQKLLIPHPGLAGKLIEALETERFFITLTFQKKYKPDDPHDLHHYYERRQFMVNDVVPALKHIAADFNAKENPTAEIKSDSWI